MGSDDFLVIHCSLLVQAFYTTKGIRLGNEPLCTGPQQSSFDEEKNRLKEVPKATLGCADGLNH